MTENLTLPGIISQIPEEIVTQKGVRDGIEIEKGVTLSEIYLEKHEELFRQYSNYFIAYPDRFLDIIKPAESNFELFFYQRIFLRSLMRFKEVFVTAPRAWSKSFITILALVLQCIFLPGSKRFICAPKKGRTIVPCRCEAA